MRWQILVSVEIRMYQDQIRFFCSFTGLQIEVCARLTEQFVFQDISVVDSILLELILFFSCQKNEY